MNETALRREQLFEQIGLQQRLFSKEQVEGARHIARQRGQPLGDVLVVQGFLSPEQCRGLERAVTYRLGRDEDKEVAKIIIESHYCAPERVEEALREQKQHYSRTGELVRLSTLLLRNEAITESQKIAAEKIHGIEQQSASGSGQRARGGRRGVPPF
ncbi:MAG: hypothetical protein D6731_25290 [Planctomycetota bacterium]|nr:MAG: hypothetical protein D6731_25290 [Planctomycetota bacterium]